MTANMSQYLNPPSIFNVILVASTGGSIAFVVWYMMSWRKYRNNVMLMKKHGPVVHQYFDPYGLVMILFAKILGWHDMDFAWKGSLTLFQELSTPAFYFVTSTGIFLCVNDPVMVADVTLTRSNLFPKAVQFYDDLRFFGDNIVTTEGAIWKAHRRSIAAAFSERNNRLVYQTTVAIINDMFASWKSSTQSVPTSTCMKQLTLAVISAAAFGKKINAFGRLKVEDDLDGDGPANKKYTMSFAKCIELVAANCILRVGLPKWAYWLPIYNLPQIDRAFKELDSYLLEIIESSDDNSNAQNTNPSMTTLTAATERKNQNLLSLLVREAFNSQNSTSADSEEIKLSTRDLLGNAFIFMLAGHETSAATLSFALLLLALHPAEQDALRKDVCSVVGDKEDIQYADLDKLQYCYAVMKEALRMFPPVVSIPKIATADTHIRSGNGRPFFIPKDGFVSLSVYTLQRCEEYYPEPNEFRPSRWLNDSGGNEQTATSFAAFSLGGRSCIGRRFAQIEIIVALAMISRRYTISVPAGVTKEQLLECKNLLTLYPAATAELLFTDRSKQ